MWRKLLLFCLYVPAGWSQTLSDQWYWRAQDSDPWKPLTENTFAEDWPGEGWILATLDTTGMGETTDKVLVVGTCGMHRVYFEGQEAVSLAKVSSAILKGSTEGFFGTPHEVFTLDELLPNKQYRITIHYRGYHPDNIRTKGLNHHFHLGLEPGPVVLARQSYFASMVSRHEMFLLGFCLSFAIIHLLLFVYYPSLKANLFYAGFTASAALLGLTFLGVMARTHYSVWITSMGLSTAVLSCNMLMAILLTYSYLLPQPPRLFKPICIFYGIISVWGWFQPFLVFEIQGSVILVGIAEISRTLLTFRRKGGEPAVPGARILLYGAVPTGLALLYQLAIFNFPWVPSPGSFFIWPIILYAPLPLMLTMSLLLSRFFAKTNRELELRLSQVQRLNDDKLAAEREHARLTAEHDRKNKELEEARILQLSMLPKKLPQLNGYSLGAYMKTAAEVGGDYYDFFVGEEQALLVVGDATGHGLRAGHMVVAAKSLLGAHAGQNSPGLILTQMGSGLKRMKFKGMFMAMSALRVQADRLRLAVAGMPPALHYQAESNVVVEISGGSLPLGAPVQYSYGDLEVALEPRDALLLMSDGLVERFNAQREMFGMERLTQTFQAHAHKKPDEIIETLVQEGEAFAKNHPLDDDISLVILQRNPS